MIARSQSIRLKLWNSTEDALLKYLRAAHFPPTVLVTSLAFLFSRPLFTLTSSIIIAVTIFSGQLVVGWTNDLIDLESDRRQGRIRKPVASGELSSSHLQLAIYADSAICIALSIFGPLGVRGGSLHLIAVGFGVSYNLYFKNTYLSPIPYIFAFAALPSTPYVALGLMPPPWLAISGGLFGIVAHFANVLKDLEQDRAIGIRGLPQLLGAKKSIIITTACLIIISTIISTQRVGLIPWFATSLPIAVALIIYRPRKFGFPTIMLLALLDVTLLIWTGH